MTVVADSGFRATGSPSSGAGTGASVSALSGHLLREVALEPDCATEDGSDQSGHRGAQGDVLGSPAGSGSRLPHRVPEGVAPQWLSFGGIAAAQVPQDYILWEVLLNENPHLEGIVELGTWNGGFAHFLNAQAAARGMHFRTFDVIAPEREIPCFEQLDIFRYAERVGELLQEWDPVVVLCDGGNKPRELKTFSRFLSPQSILVVHDWGSEMFPEDVPENVEMIYGDYCERLESRSRVFKVRDA